MRISVETAGKKPKSDAGRARKIDTTLWDDRSTLDNGQRCDRLCHAFDDNYVTPSELVTASST